MGIRLLAIIEIKGIRNGFQRDLKNDHETSFQG